MAEGAEREADMAVRLAEERHEIGRAIRVLLPRIAGLGKINAFRLMLLTAGWIECGDYRDPSGPSPLTHLPENTEREAVVAELKAAGHWAAADFLEGRCRPTEPPDADA